MPKGHLSVFLFNFKNYIQLKFYANELVWLKL